jgi:hypothetical protein
MGGEHVATVVPSGRVSVGARPEGDAATAVGNRIDLDDVSKRYRVGDVEVDALVVR